MDDKFFIGVVLGMVGGAVLATNSYKTRQAVKDGQTQILNKANEMQKKSGGQSSKSDN